MEQSRTARDRVTAARAALGPAAYQSLLNGVRLPVSAVYGTVTCQCRVWYGYLSVTCMVRLPFSDVYGTVYLSVSDVYLSLIHI